MICTYVLWSIYTMYHAVNQNKSKGQNDLPRQSYSVTILSTPFLDQAIQQLLSTQTEEDSSCPTKCSVALSIHIDLCINSKPWTRLISSLCRRLQSYPRWCYYNTKISRILRSNSSSNYCTELRLAWLFWYAALILHVDITVLSCKIIAATKRF